MKKKLEAELISIAHRILQMKNKSDLVQLHQETQKLYEKLSVLRFVEEHFSQARPTIGQAEIEDQLAQIFDQEVPAQIKEEAVVEAPQVEAIKDILSGISEKASQQQEQVEAVLEKEEQAVAEEHETVEAEGVQPDETEAPQESQEAPVEEPMAAETAITPEPEAVTGTVAETEPESQPETPKEDLFKPAFEWGFEAKKEEPVAEEPKITPAQISFDDLLGQDYVDPVFVKPEEMETPMPTSDATPASTPEQSDDEKHAAELAESNRRLADLREAANRPLSEINEPKQNVIPITRNFADTSNVIPIAKGENLNDRVSKGITIGLNDRIAFMKHLFNNSSEDYNRVLSQLITIDTLDEARNFIDTMVKPDYNNWEGKDEYEQRFMEIVEKKFS
ncbi:hypothetical protein [Flavobacterium sp.]|uniref:hypothetical protein n=1 Tax=Flavobacterium sp. TaxID=239 RepID=UPI0039E4EEDB